MNVERDNDGNIIRVEMSPKEIVDRKLLHRDLRHVPIPLREEVARHQKAYRQHLEDECRRHEAEVGGRSFASSSGGGVDGITDQMRQKLDRADRLRSKQRQGRTYEID